MRHEGHLGLGVVRADLLGLGLDVVADELVDAVEDLLAPREAGEVAARDEVVAVAQAGVAQAAVAVADRADDNTALEDFAGDPLQALAAGDSNMMAWPPVK